MDDLQAALDAANKLNAELQSQLDEAVQQIVALQRNTAAKPSQGGSALADTEAILLAQTGHPTAAAFLEAAGVTLETYKENNAQVFAR